MLSASLVFFVLASELNGGRDTAPVGQASSTWNEDNVLLSHIFGFLKRVIYKELVVFFYTIVG